VCTKNRNRFDSLPVLFWQYTVRRRQYDRLSQQQLLFLWPTAVTAHLSVSLSRGIHSQYFMARLAAVPACVRRPGGHVTNWRRRASNESNKAPCVVVGRRSTHATAGVDWLVRHDHGLSSRSSRRTDGDRQRAQRLGAGMDPMFLQLAKTKPKLKCLHFLIYRRP